MSEQVIVAFGDDGTDGDSCFQPVSSGAYVEGLTFDQAVEMFTIRTAKQWEMSVDQFKEEIDAEPVGFWVVDKKIYTAITFVDIPTGSDSAVYAAVGMMKQQLKSVADKTITK